MEYKNLKSNGPDEANFIIGFMDIERRLEKSKDLFEQFIKLQGFSSWHVHNGWVQNIYGVNGIDLIDHEDIEIVWIKNDISYCHTNRCPDIGEKMIIVKDSPDIKSVKHFKMYCYEVVEKTIRVSPRIKLKLTGIKKAVFNERKNKYELYTKSDSNILSFLKLKNLLRWGR